MINLIVKYSVIQLKKFGISGPYFPVFGLNTGTYGPEITPYLDSFQAEYLTITGTIKGTSQLKLYKEFT